MFNTYRTHIAQLPIGQLRTELNNLISDEMRETVPRKIAALRIKQTLVVEKLEMHDRRTTLLEQDVYNKAVRRGYTRRV